jgi:hypothetical protein
MIRVTELHNDGGYLIDLKEGEQIGSIAGPAQMMIPKLDPPGDVEREILAAIEAGDVALVEPPENPAPLAEPVPARVTNFQARYVMRGYKMPDGRSLFATIDGDLRAAIEATKGLDEFDPQRLEVDLQWQAWEQANDYERNGGVTRLLAGRYGFTDETTDDLFRQASTVTA